MKRNASENMSSDRAYEKLRRATLLAAGTNLGLGLGKMAAGSLFQSIALVADGVHSLSDLVSDFLVLLGGRLGSLPPDENHPYGHGKFETFSALAVALVLFIVGVGIGWEGIQSYLRPDAATPAMELILVAGISMVVKEVLFRYTRRVARAVDSPAMLANAWHQRSDALSSLAVLFGGLAGAFGFAHGDALAGIVVGIFIFWAAFGIAVGAFRELCEHAAEPEVRLRIEEILNDSESIRSWHQLRTRRVGREILVDVHIQVDPGLSILQGHEITGVLKHRLANSLGAPCNTLIHLEPDRSSEAGSEKAEE